MVKPLKSGDKPEQGTDYPAGCAWFGPNHKISPMRGSCIYFAHDGPDRPIIPWLALFTPVELGYTERKSDNGFSCKRCEYYGVTQHICSRVDENSEGDTPGEIHPNSCCDFQDADKVRGEMPTQKVLEYIAAAERGITRYRPVKEST